MNRKQKNLVRIIAIVLAALLCFSAVISAVLSFAYAEEAVSSSPYNCELKMEYLEEEQALRMSQRLVYTNASDTVLDRVLFYAPANLFRRMSALPYEDDEINAVLPKGYLPGGIDLVSLKVNGETADYGFQGQDEAVLRAACSLQPGETCEFEFEYYLLLTENAAFLGISENEWRLSAFYFMPARLDENGSFILNTPLSFTHYTDVPAMNFRAEIALPEKYIPLSSGMEKSADGQWIIEGDALRDFSMVILKKYKTHAAETASGVQLRLFSDVRSAEDAIFETAEQAIETCEAWFGPLRFHQFDFVQADYAPGYMNTSGCMWISQSLLEDRDALCHAVRRFVASQYFRYSVWPAPVSDAWLSDSVSEFLGYLLLEEDEGHDAYLAALNKNLVDSLQLTIPGGLNVTSDASLFTAYEYELVIRNRGAIVFHELYTAMGRDQLIAGLKNFYQAGLEKDVLTEMDLVHALDDASGKSWEKFLTDWVFNVGDYVNQDIYWLE